MSEMAVAVDLDRRSAGGSGKAAEAGTTSGYQRLLAWQRRRRLARIRGVLQTAAWVVASGALITIALGGVLGLR
jgi:hypothetical protein